jgi:DNA-directed RNA polymerase subunit M/transcription elongation factor TFIIS
MRKGFTKCNRCGGMMIYEKIYYETEHFWVWKCVYCGEYIDPVILENRQIQKSIREKSGKNNKEPIYRSYSDTPSI